MTDPVAEDHAWLTVADAGAVGVVRRAATALATQLGLPANRVAELAIVASELASNLHKHADGGTVLIRALRGETDCGVELVSIDAGPGMADLAWSARDGHSTAGTLGIGLGAIARQAGRLDGYSRPGRGTVLAASAWSDRPPPVPWADGLTRPMAGEQVSGDGYAVRRLEGLAQVLLCDGLGHGPLAAEATRAAKAAFMTAPLIGPRQLLAHLHPELARTRGAVCAVAELDITDKAVRFAGIGNISSWAIDGTRRAMTSMPGIVGQHAHDPVEFEYPLPAGAAVIMHTDGLNSRWDLSSYPGLLQRSPLVIAATVLRDAGSRRDDAGVVVAKVPE
jgi:anti-sigma regulatory factor (Ser/Thr protein kinase)